MFRRRRSEKQKNELLALSSDCQDRCLQTDLEGICQAVGRNIRSSDLTKREIHDLRDIFQETLDALKQRQYMRAELSLRKALQISENSSAGKAVGKSMGLISRIKKRMGKNEKASQKDLLDQEDSQARQRIYEVERKIAALYDTHTSLTKEFEAKAKRCAQLEKSDPDYGQIRLQALAMIPRMRSIENQIRNYARLLEDSSRYQAMVEMGKATFDLKQLMPDLNRSEAMMEWISQETQESSQKLDDLSSGIEHFEKEINAASSREAFSENEFDQYVQNIRSETKRQKEDSPVGKPERKVQTDLVEEVARQGSLYPGVGGKKPADEEVRPESQPAEEAGNGRSAATGIDKNEQEGEMA